MNKNLPDKWIRKAIYDRINNMVVDSNTIPCYDYRVTGSNVPAHYILVTTQSSEVDKRNKCEYSWESSVLLDIVTTYKSSGNTGSRLLADNILDSARALIDGLTLDANSGLKIVTEKQGFPSDIATITKNQNVFRKFLRLELLID